jgi:hypothetical protein
MSYFVLASGLQMIAVVGLLADRQVSCRLWPEHGPGQRAL